MSEEQDEKLVQRCLEGDRRAFEALVEKYQKIVFNVALRMTRDHADAQDIAQSAFIKAYEKLNTFDPKFKFFSWLYRIVVNESLNFLTQRRKFEELDEELVSDDTSPEDVEQENATERKIQDCLMELRVEHRVIVVLKHLQDLSYGEISNILDIPEKTVKSRLFTARAILRGLLLKKGIAKHD